MIRRPLEEVESAVEISSYHVVLDAMLDAHMRLDLGDAEGVWLLCGDLHDAEEVGGRVGTNKPDPPCSRVVPVRQ